MPLLPLALSAHVSAWNPVGVSGGVEGQRPALDASCRFCGLHAAGWQEPFHCNGDHADASLGNIVSACPLCHLCQHLDRPHIHEEAALIWLPEMSQAVLNNLVRGIHQVLHGEGQSPVQGSRPRQDTPTVRAAWRAYAALAERAPAAELHIGTSSPHELASALLDMPPSTYARRAPLLGGTRVLHRGCHFQDGADVYPGVLSNWARAGAVVTLPAFPTLF